MAGSGLYVCAQDSDSEKYFIAESVDRKSWNNEGWKIPKRDVEPIVIKGYEDIMAELDRPSAKQIDLLHYDVSAAG